MCACVNVCVCVYECMYVCMCASVNKTKNKQNKNKKKEKFLNSQILQPALRNETQAAGTAGCTEE